MRFLVAWRLWCSEVAAFEQGSEPGIGPPSIPLRIHCEKDEMPSETPDQLGSIRALHRNFIVVYFVSELKSNGVPFFRVGLEQF